MSFKGNPPAYSETDFPAERTARTAGDEPVLFTRSRKVTPPTPAPSAVDLLADVVERLAALEDAAEARERRVEEREARAEERHAQLLRAIDEAATGVSLDAELLLRRYVRDSLVDEPYDDLP